MSTLPSLLSDEQRLPRKSCFSCSKRIDTWKSRAFAFHTLKKNSKRFGPVSMYKRYSGIMFYNCWNQQDWLTFVDVVFPFSCRVAWPLTCPACNGMVSCFNLFNSQKLSMGSMSSLPLSASRLYATYERIYKQLMMWDFHDLLTFYSLDHFFS